MTLLASIRGAIFPKSADIETESDDETLGALMSVYHDDDLCSPRHDPSRRDAEGRALAQVARLLHGESLALIQRARRLRAAARNDPDALGAITEAQGKELAQRMKAARAELQAAEGAALRHAAEQQPRLSAVEAKLKASQDLAASLSTQADDLEKSAAERFAQAVLSGTDGDLKRGDDRAAVARLRAEADAERSDAAALAGALAELRAAFERRQAELATAADHARKSVAEVERSAQELAWDQAASALLQAGWRGDLPHSHDLARLVLPVFDPARVFGGDQAGPDRCINAGDLPRLAEMVEGGVSWASWRNDAAALLAKVDAHRAEVARHVGERRAVRPSA